MNFIDWNKDTITNHVAMDKEHKKMVDDMNKLSLFIISKEVEKANKLLTKIVNDLKGHFETEEKYMRKSRIPQYISHKLEHDRFYNKVKDIESQVLGNNKVLSLEHLEFVKTWFYNHLDLKDKNLAKFLIKNNIK